jgi:hypothetical protein
VRLLQRDGGVDVGYYYYDVDGYVADGPAGHGLLGLREAVDGPAFRDVAINIVVVVPHVDSSVTL